jgi:hypothetical protein
MNHNRNLTRAAAALLVAGAAGAAFAHPHPEGEGDGRKVERVIIMQDGHGDHHAKGKGERVRRFELHRPGADGHVRRLEIHGGHLADCAGGEKIVDESSGDGDKKTKVIICTKGAPTAASAERLEEALARINRNDELSAEQKAKIATALRSAIDRARSAR